MELKKVESLNEGMNRMIEMFVVTVNGKRYGALANTRDVYALYSHEKINEDSILQDNIWVTYMNSNMFEKMESKTLVYSDGVETYKILSLDFNKKIAYVFGYVKDSLSQEYDRSFGGYFSTVPIDDISKFFWECNEVPLSNKFSRN